MLDVETEMEPLGLARWRSWALVDCVGGRVG